MAKEKKSVPSRKRKPGSFGGRANRKLRERILIYGMAAMPPSWQRQWMLQRILATPPWASMHAILEKYNEAERLSQCTGNKYVVDHIVPLNHPRVCGLHVAWNLQVILYSRNERKSNYWCPEQNDMFVDGEQLILI